MVGKADSKRGTNRTHEGKPNGSIRHKIYGRSSCTRTFRSRNRNHWLDHQGSRRPTSSSDCVRKMSNIDINDVVEITTLDDVNEAKKNLVGTVVFVFGDPEKHYEIEITDSEGRTIETLTLPESSLRKIWP